MILNEVPQVIGRIINATIKGLGWVANFTIAAIILVIVGNVVGRYFFHKSLLGTLEIVELFAVLFACLSMAYCASVRGHVRIDVLTSRLSRRTQSIVYSIGFFLCAAICPFIIYQGFILGLSFAQDPNQVSTLLNIPLSPFRFILVFGFLLIFLVMLVLGFRLLPSEEELKEGLDR